MEVSSLKNNSIRIKTKNATLLIDPPIKVEADIAIFTNPQSIPQEFLSDSEGMLVIQGPGEYEVKGISIVGSSKAESLYSISADNIKLLLVKSTNIDTLEEDGEYSGLLVKMSSDIKDTIFSHVAPTSLLMLYGDKEYLHISSDTLKNVTKVNLKKKEEFVGSAVILSE